MIGATALRKCLTVLLYGLLCATCLVSLTSCAVWNYFFVSKIDGLALRHAKGIDIPVKPSESAPYCTVNCSAPLTAITKPEIYVYKSQRRLMVVQEGVLVRDYQVGLGPRVVGDKAFRGDGRTPEGDYFVCVRNPNSRFYKSLGLNYPLPKHAEKGLTTGEIGLEEFRQILDAYDTRTKPPWNTALGGEIFIHGGGATEDWTLGCVALSNRAMDELFEVIPVGTPVHIFP
ncbi:MAG: murein L,D-transpeptidase family protein [Syntrophobacteraceae bacterium]